MIPNLKIGQLPQRWQLIVSLSEDQEMIIIEAGERAAPPEEKVKQIVAELIKRPKTMGDAFKKMLEKVGGLEEFTPEEILSEVCKVVCFDGEQWIPREIFLSKRNQNPESN